MRVKDPIAPTSGMFTGGHKWFAWRPVTTVDGYAVWLENVYKQVICGGNDCLTQYRPDISKDISKKSRRKLLEYAPNKD